MSPIRIASPRIELIFALGAATDLLDPALGAHQKRVAIIAANPVVDPWAPGAGRNIVIPTQHLLPQAPHDGIVVNSAELRL